MSRQTTRGGLKRSTKIKKRRNMVRKKKSHKNKKRRRKKMRRKTRRKKHAYAGSTDTSCNAMIDCREKIQPNGPLEPGNYVCINNNCERITFGALPALPGSPPSHSPMLTGGKKKKRRRRMRGRKSRKQH